MRVLFVLMVGLCLVAGSLVSCSKDPETGKRRFIITSEAEENQLGEQAFAETLAKYRVSSDTRWNGVVQRVGKRIAAAANKPDYQWEFRVLDSPEKNAFCLPGGKVAVFTGILPVAKNEAGLAAILGHEVRHATARHAGQRMSEQFVEQLGFAGLQAILAGQVSPEDQKIMMGVLGLGATVGISLPFSRGQESEADEIGLVYAARAGYDPGEAPAFWDRMAAGGGGALPAFLSDHPASPDRKKALTEQLPKVMPVYAQSPKYGVGETFGD